MAKFCKYCGNPLNEGKPCNCPKARASRPQPEESSRFLRDDDVYSPRHQKSKREPLPFSSDSEKRSYRDDIFSDEYFYNSYKNDSDQTDDQDEYDEYDEHFLEGIKNRIGIGSPELNHGDPFERNEDIVPESVEACEGEIPVKQYTVAKLRSRIIGIPYTRALGRMQVTNKRLIFRAAGKCLAGRTTLQQEFSINEISGLEVRREYLFNVWDLLAALFVAAFGAIIMGVLFGIVIPENFRDTGTSIFCITAPIAVLTGCFFLFFRVYKRWLLKILCFGACLGLLVACIISLIDVREDVPDFFAQLFGPVALICFVFFIVLIVIYCVRPNLAIIVKTKSSLAAIDIKRRRSRIFALNSEDHTGFTEVIPENDAEKYIKEIGAIITDIQQLGDLAIKAWQD